MSSTPIFFMDSRFARVGARSVARVALLAALAVLAACARPTPAPGPAAATDTPAARAAALEARAANLPSVTGTQAAEGLATEYTAWYDGKALVMLRTTTREGSVATTEATAFYAGGAPFRYVAKELRLQATGPAAGSEEATRVMVDWPADGRPAQALRLAHAGEQKLSVPELAALMGHLRELAEVAEDERSAQLLTPSAAPPAAHGAGAGQ